MRKWRRSSADSEVLLRIQWTYSRITNILSVELVEIKGRPQEVINRK